MNDQDDSGKGGYKKQGNNRSFLGWAAGTLSMASYFVMNSIALATEDKRPEEEIQELDSVETKEVKLTEQNFKEIIENLKQNDFNTSRLDITVILNSKELKELEEAIRENTELGYISWHLRQINHLELMDRIEAKLKQNNKDYKYYPTDYVHCLLSRHVYANATDAGVKLSEDTEAYLKHWRIEKVYNDTDDTGYYASIYINDKTHQVVLAVRGSESIIKGLLSKNSDWKTDLEEILVGKVIVGQQAWNCWATEEAVRIAKVKGYRLSFTGHSLGAWLAELGAFYSHTYFKYHNVKAVTFDSPGSKEMMVKLGPNIESHETIDLRDIDITTYLAAPNPINSCNQHVGRVYRVNRDMKLTEWADNNIVKNNKLHGVLSLEGHLLSGILAAFSPTTGKPRQYTRIADWPRLEYKGGEKDLSYVIDKYTTPSLKQKTLAYGINYLISGTTLTSFVSLLANLVEGKIYQDEYWEYFKYIDSQEGASNSNPRRDLSFDQRFALAAKAHYREDSGDVYTLKPKPGSLDNYLYELGNAKENLEKEIEGLPEIIRCQLEELSSDFRVSKVGDGEFQLIPLHGLDTEIIRQRMQRIIDVIPSRLLDIGLERVVISTTTTVIVQAVSKLIEGQRMCKLVSNIPRDDLGYTYEEITDRRKALENRLIEETVVVISGIGGMGKTTLAQRYGHERHQKGWQVRWIEGEHIEQEFLLLAKEMGLETEKQKPEKVRDLVYGNLANRQEIRKEQLLLIFDNVVDQERINSYLINLPPHAKIIITTRDPKLMKGYKAIKMRGFSHEEASSYLTRALNKSKSQVDELIKEVGVSPFRLRMVAAYLDKNSLTTISAFIRDYKAIKAGKAHDADVYPEVHMLFRALRNQVPQSWQLLKYLAYLDAEGVPLELIDNIMSAEGNLQKYVNELERLSLLKVLDVENRIVFKVTHRIVQEETIKAIMEIDQSEQQQIVLKLMTEAYRLLPDGDQGGWKKAARLIRSVEALMQKADELNISYDVGYDGKASLLGTIGEYYYHEVSDFHIALKYWEEALNIREDMFPDNNPFVALSLHRVGIAYEGLGGLDNTLMSLEYYEEALNMYKALFSEGILPANHSSLASLLNSMGSAYAALGDKNKALEYYKDGLNMYKASLPGNRSSVASSLCSVGVAYQALGGEENIREALKYYTEALNIREALFGEEDNEEHQHHLLLNIASSLHSIGSAYQALGGKENIREGLKYQEDALKIYRALSPGDNLNVASVLDHMGGSYQALEVEEDILGLKYLEDALNMKKNLFKGKNHPDVADSLGKVGMAYEALEGEENALTSLKYLEDALNMRKALFPGNHPDVALSLNNVGSAYAALGDSNKALEYYKQAYSICLVSYGAESARTQGVRENVEHLQPDFFTDKGFVQKLQMQKCFGGNAVGSECRQIIFSHGKVDDNLLILKKRIQKSVLDNIVQSSEDYGWSIPTLTGDWGVRGYIEQDYLKRQLGDLGNSENNIEIAQMLCFESMNLGIMKSAKKPYNVVESFTRTNLELVKKIAKEHPEFFVDGTIVTTCIKAMSGHRQSQEFKDYMLKHVEYMGREESQPQLGV